MRVTIFLWNQPNSLLLILYHVYSLHQKYGRLILFILVFCKQLAFLLSHLSFLSFHNVHQTHAGTVLHQSSCDPLLPTPSQLFSISKEVLGITQLIPSIQKNMFLRFAAVLQCMNTWLLISAACSHIKHLEQIWISLLCSTSCVKQSLLITNQMKHEILFGILTFQNSFQGHFVVVSG